MVQLKNFVQEKILIFSCFGIDGYVEER